VRISGASILRSRTDHRYRCESALSALTIVIVSPSYTLTHLAIEIAGTNGDALEYVISAQLMGLGFTILYASVLVLVVLVVLDFELDLDLDLALALALALVPALARALDMVFVDVFDLVLAVAILVIHAPIYQVYYLP
jgi:hypothetical protein